jgi:hypothetical protein
MGGHVSKVPTTEVDFSLAHVVDERESIGRIMC